VGADLSAIGCAAVAKSGNSFFLIHRMLSFDYRFAADRRQANSHAFGRSRSMLAASFLILPEGRGSRLVGDRLRSSREVRQLTLPDPPHAQY
jgi:hypothetical protein